MSASDELKKKKGQPTELELCILMAGSLESPEDAAAELLALRERVAKLELAIINALNPGEPKAHEILESALRGAE